MTTPVRVNPFGTSGPFAPTGLGQITGEITIGDRGPRYTADGRRAVELVGYPVDPSVVSEQSRKASQQRDAERRAEALAYIQAHDGMPDELSEGVKCGLADALLDSRRSWESWMHLDFGFAYRKVVLRSFWRVKDPDVMAAMEAQIDRGVRRMLVDAFLTMVAGAIGGNSEGHEDTDLNDAPRSDGNGRRANPFEMREAMISGTIHHV